jgi:hypothetical protein
MARRNNPARRPRPSPPVWVQHRIETGPDGYDYEVRPVSASRALKMYRCPGCDHEIRIGTPHLVVWSAEANPADRRHWHSTCWSHRATRAPTRKWS